VEHPSSNAAASDDQLVAAARSGDERAFETLLRRHESRVLRVLRLLGIHSNDRDDVAQEVFVRVFRHLSGFRTGHTFEAWVYRIAVNACHDHRRRASRRQREEIEARPLLGTEESSAAHDEQVGLRDLLEQALDELSERERAVFVLCELEGMENKGVARTLGISTITVRRHLSRARTRLQRKITESRKTFATD